MRFVPQSVHRVPESGVLVGHQLSVTNKLGDRGFLEHAVDFGRKVVAHGLFEEKIAAIDEALTALGFFVESGNVASLVSFKHAEA